MLTLQDKIEVILIWGKSTTHRMGSSNERHLDQNVQQSTVSRNIATFISTGSVESSFKRQTYKT